ncbi:putative amidohydrolase [Lyophyllum shimeji]|uniref:Amidohydrolase n=1 Tax=Lyophyllum shimeji TaxID=47721 RepID=A0A9P3UTY6_LYOSH|nr:putative amidohydrolase [Lyophyllum shimeji]
MKLREAFTGSGSKSPYASLQKAAFTYPAIDNHAHPLLQAKNRLDMPFEGIISEAEGDALTTDALHTLACHRATRELAKLFGLPDGASWEDVKGKRSELEYVDLCKRCFEPARIQCILIDDGLGANNIVHGISWHDQFTHSPARRVVRIEVIAQDILTEQFTQLSSPASVEDLAKALSSFAQKLGDTLTQCAADPFVVAFKSIVCYRTGMAVSLGPDATFSLGAESKAHPELFAAYERVFAEYRGRAEVRLQEKLLNDYVVRAALKIAGNHKKPVQFHTGLGDSDITLALSSPAHLQPVIKAYPDTTFVLLHSSYPYTRDAGYLTAVYPNVFLDFGEIFPFVAGHGQRSVIRQVLELAPTNKIMWSTDGHFWPESYYLGTMQARQALCEVLSEIVHLGELSEPAAVQIIQNALFHNANRVYRLGLEPYIKCIRSYPVFL